MTNAPGWRLAAAMLLLAATLPAARAQTEAWAGAAQTPGAPEWSAAAGAPAAPHAPTPTELRDGALSPGDMRPERPVVPQLTVPLGRTPLPPTGPLPRAPRATGAASSALIDDAAARCEARYSEYERRRCREQLAYQARGARAP
jgi:hypothetical protein